jgi:hypothetical protein
VGECHLHTVEVTGSIPVSPTQTGLFEGRFFCVSADLPSDVLAHPKGAETRTETGPGSIPVSPASSTSLPRFPLRSPHDGTASRAGGLTLVEVGSLRMQTGLFEGRFFCVSQDLPSDVLAHPNGAETRTETGPGSIPVSPASSTSLPRFPLHSRKLRTASGAGFRHIEALCLSLATPNCLCHFLCDTLPRSHGTIHEAAPLNGSLSARPVNATNWGAKARARVR